MFLTESIFNSWIGKLPKLLLYKNVIIDYSNKFSAKLISFTSNEPANIYNIKENHHTH